MLKKTFLLLVLAVSVLCVSAQNYKLEDLEESFLKNNYALIASQYDIEIAEAAIVQEKLWPNPSISIGEINLWKNKGSEEMPAIIGRWGKTQQIAAELEQIIETAGKRRKRTAVRSLEKNNALLDFEELMRELKKELRQNYHTLYALQQKEELLIHFTGLYEQMRNQYKNQSEKNNIPRSELFRVQSELTALELEQIQLENEISTVLYELRWLTAIKDLQVGQIVFDIPNLSQLKSIPANILETAIEQNIVLKRQSNELAIAHKSLELERANRRPDLALNVNYDRGGGIMRNFVGVGFNMDLPIWNRNKGNIKAAQLAISREETEVKAIEWSLEHEISRLIEQIGKFEKILSRWQETDEDGFKEMIDNYQKHLSKRQITLMEFIDFTRAFIENRAAYQDVLEHYTNTVEELKYISGKDF